jgi:hypothetical protein
MLSMLVGLEEISEMIRNAMHKGLRSARIVKKVRCHLSLPHEGAILRYDPPFFD